LFDLDEWEQALIQPDQDEKETLNLAGEFLVAGELLRRSWPVSLSYSKEQKFQITIRIKDEVFPLEIKTTRDSEWSVRSGVKHEERIFVFVRLPRTYSDAPEYFIMTGADLYAALTPRRDAGNPSPPKRSKYADHPYDDNVKWEPP
jgi:hypothetical protein